MIAMFGGAQHREKTVFETIAEIDDPNVVRILVAALKGYGFHPLDRDNDGPPGLPGFTGFKGLPISVPEGEAAEARVLTESLLRDMGK